MCEYFGNRISILLCLLVAAALLSSVEARAQEPCGGVTCDSGTTCEYYEGTDVGYCAPAPCDTDDDCSDYMLCVSRVEPDCPENPDPGCHDGESDAECAARADEWVASCPTREYQQCEPKWDQYCSRSSDCGEGFECRPYQNCDCPGDSQSDFVLEPIQGCDCEPREEGHCDILDDSCETDSDCPQVWQCMELNTGPCVAPEGGSEEDCVYEEQVKRCVYVRVGLTASATGEPIESTTQTDDVATEETAQEEAKTSDQAGGCSVQRHRGGFSNGLFALLGLLLLLRRSPRSGQKALPN